MLLHCFVVVSISVRMSGQGTNGSVDFLSPVTAVGRVLIGVPQIIGGGRFFDKEGDRVKAAEARYKGNGVRLQFSSVED